MTQFNQIQQECNEILERWLADCTRNGKISRNTVAIGIIVFDHLQKKCPVEKADVVSKGGEITGARSGLQNILEKYTIPRHYLKEATTRQSHQDGQRLFEALQWGQLLAQLSAENRNKLLQNLIGQLRINAYEWLQQQNLKLDIDRRQTPTSWIHLIIENAKDRSGGVVEQHLVGAKLERRFKSIDVPNHPAHAGDQQTARAGDFTISKLVYHVTAAPSRNVMRRCAANISAALYPILLVPSAQKDRAGFLAQEEGIVQELTIVAIEDFVALNILELAAEENADYFQILKDIVQIYNRRLAQVETDLSLKIEVS